ncbi:hypothetical protein VSVS05_04325 (plasmid) [Vibrio scophthalmi]|uniref:Uncharacterized protein n=1 Tax=Vibrio scophthalmi TaxID=45658 RepID=A0A1C7FHF1_9VIBR|nr:hypothetical protein VSVS05_04325 [Vibrio scophthalmi]
MYPHEVVGGMEFRLEQWLKEHKKRTVSQETMRRRTHKQRLEIALTTKRRRTKQFLKTGFERQSNVVDCDLLISASIRQVEHAQ